MPESALIITAPEAEPVVKAWRERFDPSAAVGVPAQLDDIEREFMQQHDMRLPVKATAKEVWLIENTSGRWKERETFQLLRR